MTRPLTPPNCDLADFAFMPMDVARLFASEFHAVSTDAEWRAGVTLWLKSFHQSPAASLPNDDVMLARLAEFGRDKRSWMKVRQGALRGWVECDDGRLYHPVVAEKALEGWLAKLTHRLKSGVGNKTRWGTDFDPAPLEAEIEVARRLLFDLDPSSKALAKPGRKQSKGDPAGSPTGTLSAIPQGSQETGTGTETVREDSRQEDDLSFSTELSNIGDDPTPRAGACEAGTHVPEREGKPLAGETAGTALVPSPSSQTGHRVRNPKPRKADLSPAEAEEFDQFWRVYPLRVARQAAEKAFANARRNGVDLDLILGAAERYAEVRSGQDPSKTAHGATWLNGARWMDEDVFPPAHPAGRGWASGGGTFLDMAADAITEGSH